ncbi:hypothetical protein SS05631_b62060 (plasmid) [Sinorhizobium sp. CCBAU 05631]|uniref:Uncharacterized protein n=1 Tax=Rhizobium fredii TaxID=380 RepID=A0A2L0HGE9_RHIFR|nr:hypothetical protein SS05631_b62060 [Sinorhizobium sp. CCBAU 05631]AUX80487.1 hypothetical protein NXT3_PC01335 [Sinorhizobium fredii]
MRSYGCTVLQLANFPSHAWRAPACQPRHPARIMLLQPLICHPHKDGGNVTLEVAATASVPERQTSCETIAPTDQL